MSLDSVEFASSETRGASARAGATQRSVARYPARQTRRAGLLILQHLVDLPIRIFNDPEAHVADANAPKRDAGRDDPKGGVPTGIRTRVSALKGPRPRPLDDGDSRTVAVDTVRVDHKHPIL
jgi:hypothetical protein